MNTSVARQGLKLNTIKYFAARLYILTHKYRTDTFWQEKKSRSQYRSGTMSFRPSSSNSSLAELTQLTAFHLVAPKDLPFFWSTKAQVQPRISAWDPLLACNAIASFD